MSTRNAAALEKAATLVEALPWIQAFRGKTFAVKYGGNAMTSPALQQAFAQDIVFLHQVGLRIVVVHGGGPQITRHLERLGVPSEFRGGLRVTDEETMKVVRMVLTGEVNPDVVAVVNQFGPYAVGLSGEDANLFTAERRTATVDGEQVDVGYVGDVIEVWPQVVDGLLAQLRIPVVATVARGYDGHVYNVNADTAASALAVALGAEKLVLLTDVEGLYADWPAEGPVDPSELEVISHLTLDELEALLPDLHEGMVPKMEASRVRTSWTAGCRTPCCWRSSPMRVWGPW